MHLLLFCTVFFLFFPSLSMATEEILTTVKDQKSVSVTIYNADLALVRDQREVDLPKGRQTLAIRGVSAQIQPETTLLASESLNLIEQNFEYDLLSPDALLQKYVGLEVGVVKVHPTTGEEEVFPARVLSAVNGVVLQIGDRIETGIPGRLVYPDVPKTLRDKPTLTMLVDSDKDGGRDLSLSYLTGGLSWRADYVAELNEDDTGLDMSGWVTLENESGASYNNAKLQLVAGDVNRVQKQIRLQAKDKARMAAAMPMAEDGMQEESMFEYHLYSLGRPTSIENNQQKQVALMQAQGVTCKKEFLLQGANYYYSSRVGEIGRKLKVGVYVQLKNEKESGLGVPLPAGVVRVYKKDSGGGLQFVGEDRIDHTPEKETVRLKLGEAFDVTADKKQTNFTKLSGFGPYNYRFESTYGLTLKNGKKEKVVVKVLEPIPGDWEMLESSLPHVKESASAASWLVEVPPLESVELTYKVRVRY